METIKFKPSFSKIIVTGIFMGCVIVPAVILLSRDNVFDISSAALTMITGLFTCILFCTVLFNLPYFVIEVSDRHIFGPYLLSTSWQQTQMTIEEIDLKNIRSFRWVGFYFLKSSDGAMITICCFNEQRFNQLFSALTSRLDV